MRSVKCAMSALALLSSANAMAGKDLPQPPVPIGYDDPGPKPDNPLPAIMAKLRVQLKDPYSIRDFVLCDLSASSPHYDRFDKSWTRSSWSIMFALNAKNSYGGYTGQRDGRAYFRDGQLERLFFGSDEIRTNLDADLARMKAQLLERCQRIPDEEIQKLVSR